jgi:hypothetical protein
MKVYVVQIDDIDWYYLYNQSREVLAEGTAKEIHKLIKEKGYVQISYN